VRELHIVRHLELLAVVLTNIEISVVMTEFSRYERLNGLLQRFAVVGVLGARQTGKSTLARLLQDVRPL
jgi:predicted AAA+ superfamily ATPase